MVMALAAEGAEEPNPIELNNLGAVYRTHGNFAAAERCYRAALAAAEEQAGGEHPEIASIAGNLAELYSHQGALLRAEPLYRRAVTLQQKLAPEHPRMAVLLGNQAELYRKLGDSGRAFRLLRQALRVTPPERVQLAATLHRNLAAIHAWDGELSLAEQALVRAVALRGDDGDRHELDRVRRQMRTARAGGRNGGGGSDEAGTATLWGRR